LIADGQKAAGAGVGGSILAQALLSGSSAAVVVWRETAYLVVHCQTSLSTLAVRLSCFTAASLAMSYQFVFSY